jgi:hypothetical protein
MVENVAQRDLPAPKSRRREAVEILVQLAWRGITGLGS